MSYDNASELPEDQQYWFNTYTREVEHPASSDYRKLIGPYATRAEAEQALQAAERRNEAWDESDQQWQDGR